MSPVPDAMRGPEIIVRSLSRLGVEDTFGNLWQYHSRSDRHSKVACWSMLFDLLRESSVLAEHVRRGIVGFGINHEMREFSSGRRKNLDLVLCTPRGEAQEKITFAGLAEEYQIVLKGAERKELAKLPALRRVEVGSVHLALEAKACMTAHIKALPRLYDELNSSHAAIHGSAAHSIAAGFAMVNLGDTFVSTDRNKRKRSRTPFAVSVHRQPAVTLRTIEKLKEIPRRVNDQTPGFDALGIVVIRLANDGSPVQLVVVPPAPAGDDPWNYDQMIRRMASLYATKFGNL